jgi:hypothetical protein
MPKFLSQNNVSPSPSSTLQLNSQSNQARISRNTQCSQNRNRIPARPEFLPPQSIVPDLTDEKLFIAFITSIYAHKQYAPAIRCKQSPDTVKLRREDFQHDERE